jgi:hypothetical protein
MFYDELRAIKRDIEFLIPEEFHNNKDILGLFLFRTYYTEYIKDVNKSKFEIYLKKVELIEKNYLKSIKEIFHKILTISDCKCTPQSVQKLFEECNLLNHFEKWNVLKNECFPREDLFQRKSRLAPKFQ